MCKPHRGWNPPGVTSMCGYNKTNDYKKMKSTIAKYFKFHTILRNLYTKDKTFKSKKVTLTELLLLSFILRSRREYFNNFLQISISLFTICMISHFMVILNTDEF